MTATIFALLAAGILAINFQVTAAVPSLLFSRENTGKVLKGDDAQAVAKREIQKAREEIHALAQLVLTDSDKFKYSEEVATILMMTREVVSVLKPVVQKGCSNAQVQTASDVISRVRRAIISTEEVGSGAMDIICLKAVNSFLDAADHLIRSTTTLEDTARETTEQEGVARKSAQSKKLTKPPAKQDLTIPVMQDLSLVLADVENSNNITDDEKLVAEETVVHMRKDVRASANATSQTQKRHLATSIRKSYTKLVSILRPSKHPETATALPALHPSKANRPGPIPPKLVREEEAATSKTLKQATALKGAAAKKKSAEEIAKTQKEDHGEAEETKEKANNLKGLIKQVNNIHDLASLNKLIASYNNKIVHKQDSASPVAAEVGSSTVEVVQSKKEQEREAQAKRKATHVAMRKKRVAYALANDRVEQALAKQKEAQAAAVRYSNLVDQEREQEEREQFEEWEGFREGPLLAPSSRDLAWTKSMPRTSYHDSPFWHPQLSLDHESVFADPREFALARPSTTYMAFNPRQGRRVETDDHHDDLEGTALTNRRQLGMGRIPIHFES